MSGSNASEQLWQPKLWRALLADVGEQDYWNNRAQLHQRFLERASNLTTATRPAGLPRRVIVFGISALPQQTLEMLDALKGHTQVILCVHNPCQFHWADIVDGRQELNQISFRQQRFAYKAGMSDTTPDDVLHTQTHPLLAAWGKQGRDYIRLLDLFDETRQKQAEFNELSFELFDEAPTDTTLQQLQNDVLQLRPLSESSELWPAKLDDSIVFHRAHSPQREVEILHDQLLAAFIHDPQLKPRDIMVMVPDVDTYAPHIQAVFGRLETSDPRFIPFTIADQSQRQRNPLLVSLERVLNAPHERFAMSEVFDMLQVPAVQARFGFSESDLPQLQQWITEAGIRWGLHAEHQEALGLPANLEQNSWRFGLRRMLLGYATGAAQTSQHGAWQDIEPYDEVGGLQAALVGPLVQFIDVLDNAWEELQADRTPAAWIGVLMPLLDELFLAESEHDLVLLGRLQEQLNEWREACAEAQFDEAVPLNIVREAWLGQIDEQQLNQRFLAGAVNFATLMPMRAIPFKQVYLLGMNDGDYPRSTKPLDFDLMAHDRRPGDRSRREDDRYLFLEALLSARDKFYVSWIGRSVRDNSERPPSVLVSQLLEHLEQGWEKPTVTDHRLQPFADDYFKSSQPEKLFTYAHEWLVALANNPVQAEATEPARLPPWLLDTPLTIKQLSDFLREPARLLFQQRLQVYLQDAQLTAVDDEVFASNALEDWGHMAALTAAMERAAHQDNVSGDEIGVAVAQKLAQLQREGALPMGSAGELEQHQLLLKIEVVAERYRRLRALTAKPLLAIVSEAKLTDSMQLTDSISNLYEALTGERIYLSTTPSQIRTKKAKQPQVRLKHASHPWVAHLLLNTERETRTLLVGQDSVMHLAPISGEEAQQQLRGIGAAVAENFQHPLPVTLELAEAAAEVTDDVALATLYDDGAFQRTALKDRAPYCRRVYPEFASIAATQQLQHYIEALYQPMQTALAAGDEWLEEQGLL